MAQRAARELRLTALMYYAHLFAVALLTCAVWRAAAEAPARWEQRIESAGVVAQVSIEAADGGPLRAAAPARVRVALSNAADGSALARLLPAVWIDADDGREADAQVDCARRIGRYARASGVNPQVLVDLNGYDVLALDAAGRIAVLDPRTQFFGRTSLRATVPLPGPGFDWASDAADRHLWVSIPAKRAIALIDMPALRVLATLALPDAPARVRIEPGTGRLWAAVPRKGHSAGGLVVIEPQPPHTQQWIELSGTGHTELAFDPAGWVAVTQRDTDVVSFIDPTTLHVVHRERIDLPRPTPLNVLFDAAARRYLVAEGRHGVLLAFDHRGRSAGRLSLSAGIGPMAASPDGRWLLVANPAAHRVHVVDLVAWRAVHVLPVSGRPYEIAVTSAYAYVRALDTEALGLVSLASLASTPRVQNIAIGERPPAHAAHLPLAGTLAPMPDGRGSFIVSPADNAIYVYMEGMNAASGAVSVRGHELRSVRLARRGLREVSPGVHVAEVLLPPVERLLVALATEGPRTRMCTKLTVASSGASAAWQLLWEAFPRSPREPRLAVRLLDAPSDALPEMIVVRLVRPGVEEHIVHLRRGADGSYTASVPQLDTGLWYAHPEPPTGQSIRWPYVSFLRVQEDAP
ncbi:MAG: YncE family protein [Burkholderiaceae bacterium]|nr:YncE family protein [Burkholderiaceae bacterium]